MTRSEHPLLIEIAGRVADGETLEFGELAETHPDLAGHVRRLRQLADLAHAFETPAAPDTPATWGPLRVLARIGEGSFGEVFRAHDPRLQRDVALKLARRVSDPRVENEHLTEARRLASVQHPGVLAVHGVETHDGRVGIWTDFIRGRTLEQRIQHDPPLSFEALIGVGSALADALAAVHGAGVLHGDVKAANVMQEEPSGRIVLMDFGAAHAAGASAQRDELTRGTPLVTAPERLEGRHGDERADVYSLAVLLYRLATGRYPYDADTLAELRQAFTSTVPVPLVELRPDLPATFDAVVSAGMAVDPAERPSGAASFGAQLSSMIGLDPAADGVEEPAGLPPADGRFIGRQADIARLRAALEDSPVITLFGPGGVGKTRLAREVLRGKADAFPDGVYWIDLVPLRNRADVAQRALDVVGRRLVPGEVGLATLADALKPAAACLVLDNAEHVLDVVAEIVTACHGPHLRILVTSRVPLGIANETVDMIEPLSVPPAPEGPVEADELFSYDAVRLLAERAWRAGADAGLDPRLAPEVSRLCRRLDGLPLGIELAAARLRTMPLADLVTRLDRGFDILVARESEDDDDRHRTINAMLNWSYDLLDDGEQKLFRRLAVFEGTFTSTTAEHVCADELVDSDDPPSSPVHATIDGEPVVVILGRLVEHSLVQPLGPHGYRLLVHVQSFGRRVLDDRGESVGAFGARRAYLRKLAKAAEQALIGPDQVRWIEELERLEPDIIAVVRAIPTDAAVATEAALILGDAARFFSVRGHLHLGRELFEHLLSREPAPDDPACLLKVRTWAAHFCHDLGQYEAAIAHCEENVRRLGTDGDKHAIAVAKGTIAAQLVKLGRLEEARDQHRGCLAVFRDLNADFSVRVTLLNLGLVELRLGALDDAQVSYEEAIDLMRAAGDQQNLAMTLNNLACLHAEREEFDAAEPHWEESLEIRRQLRDRAGMAQCLGGMGKLAGMKGKMGTARARLLEALRIEHELGSHYGLSYTLSFLVPIVRDQRGAADAVTLISAAFALRHRILAPFSDDERAVSQRETLDPLQAELSAEAYEEAWERGRLMDVDQAVAFAQNGA